MAIPLPPAGHKQSKDNRCQKRRTVAWKNYFEPLLWAKLLLIIAVNFGNKTKVFSENFGWLYVTEHLKHKHLAHT